MNQQQVTQARGFEKVSMSRIEAGKTKLTPGTLLKIDNAMQMEIKELFYQPLIVATVLSFPEILRCNNNSPCVAQQEHKSCRKKMG